MGATGQGATRGWRYPTRHATRWNPVHPRLPLLLLLLRLLLLLQIVPSGQLKPGRAKPPCLAWCPIGGQHVRAHRLLLLLLLLPACGR